MTKLQSRSVLVGILLLLSVGLLALNQTGALTPVKNALLVPLTGMQRGVSQIWRNISGVFQRGPDDATLRQQVADLESENAQLKTRLTQLEENQANLTAVSRLVDYASNRKDEKYLAAHVIGFDASPYLGYIFLDRGSNDGVESDMPVVTEAGLVGHVVEVTSAACKVLLITDPNSPVNARLQRSRDVGVVVGQLTSGLEMQYLAQNADVQPGDGVITSGLGGKYPAGLTIGAVTVVQRQDYEVQQKAAIASPVDFRNLEIVLILINFKPVDFSPFGQSTPAP
jgi:rod shape-determining protein MreC